VPQLRSRTGRVRHGSEIRHTPFIRHWIHACKDLVGNHAAVQQGFSALRHERLCLVPGLPARIRQEVVGIGARELRELVVRLLRRVRVAYRHAPVDVIHQTRNVLDQHAGEHGRRLAPVPVQTSPLVLPGSAGDVGAGLEVAGSLPDTPRWRIRGYSLWFTYLRFHGSPWA
jgi:hypothetical protein